MLSPSRQHRLLPLAKFSAFCPPPAPSAMKLPTASTATHRVPSRCPALRGPPPLTCGEADGCVAWRNGPQGQDRATCCIAHPFGGYAAKPRRAPSSFLLHYAGRTRPRQTRCAGLPVKGTSNPGQFATLNCTPPGRGKSQAIEHNRALPKVGQSLRRLRLVAYRCAPCGFG